MTQHNLKEHLRWLLSEKPFIPTLLSLPGYDPSALQTSATLSQSHISASQFDTRHDLDPFPSPPTARTAVSTAQQESRAGLDTSHTSIAETEEEVDMARLRTAPGTIGKPRLMVQNLSPANLSPNRRQRDAHNIGNSAARSSKPSRIPHGRDETSLSPNPYLEPSRRLVDWENTDAIDLTLGSQGSVKSSPMSGSKGKKRKSEDYEFGMHQSARPTRRKKSTCENQDGMAIMEDDFPDIETISSPPSDPPPPYSTIAHDPRTTATCRQTPSRKTTQAIPTTDFDGVDDDSVFFITEMETRITTETRNRKSRSRVPAHNSPPSRKAVKQVLRSPPEKRTVGDRSNARSNLTNSTSPARRNAPGTILDSEDDEFEDWVPDIELETPSRIPASAFRDKSSSPRKAIHQANSPMAGLAHSASQTRSQTGHMTVPESPIQQKAKAQSIPTKVHFSSSQQAYTPQRESHVKSSNSSEREQSSAELSRNEKMAVAKFVSDPNLFEISNRLSSVSSRLREVSDHIYKQIDLDGVPTDELVQAKKQLRYREQALSQLSTLVGKLKMKNNERAELGRQVMEAVEDIGEIPKQLGEESKAAASAVKHLEAEVFFLFEPAGLMECFQNPQTVIKTTNGQDHIIVRSTQVSPAVEDHGTRPPLDSSEFPQTQFIRQTQMGNRETWTPDMQVRFAPSPMRKPLLEYTSNIPPRAPPNGQTRKSKDLAESHTSLTSRYDSAARRESDSNLQSHTRHEYPIYRRSSEQYDFDTEENLFSNCMGSPLARVVDDDEFDMEFDQDLLDAAENVEDHASMSVFAWRDNSREMHRQSPRKSDRQRKATIQASPKKIHRWSVDVKHALKSRFRLRGFRPHQLEAINATLAGEDAFVLMPTGGGKSLCYQLPAIITSGKTRGVTIVVSPLLSLMEDQVNHLKALHIQAFLINGESSPEHKRNMMKGLREPDVETYMQLLYVTPEMLIKNQAMVNAFKALHQRGRLARFVIDEAHCVSQWGHDFRPDYKAIGDVRAQFAGVPVLALTATATELVKKDVLGTLGIDGRNVFTQSFNRPNLSYEVRKKGKDVVANIAETITEKYKGKSGIVYCLSRKACEGVAEKLRGHHVKAHHYHAGMDAQERSSVQRKWQANEYHVIVATIAFGMGIDKPDVRFVIHHSIPKSLEGYYQETGRAGRDGKWSGCYLYYGYQDTHQMRKMIDEGEGSWEQKERQRDMLRQVVQFCENKSDCRRVQVLKYFSESFNRELCKDTCDNCKSDSTFENKDLSEYAAAAIRLVRQIQGDSVTLLQCVDIFRGAKGKKTSVYSGLDEFGSGTDIDRGDVERLFHRLIDDYALQEESVMNKAGFNTNYVQVGRKADDYLRRRKRLALQVRITPSNKPKAPRSRKGISTRSDYPSTNISSPVQAVSDRRLGRRVIEVDEDNDDGFVIHNETYDDESDAFEFAPVREGKARSRADKKKELGPPITVDQNLSKLNALQREVLEDFMSNAKAKGIKIMMDKHYRSRPFSDTILKQMFFRLPTTTSELLEIPGINKDMVDLYGSYHLRLIKEIKAVLYPAETHHEAPTKKRKVAQRCAYDAEEERDREDAPMDPNHDIVDLCTSASESEYDTGPSDDDFVDDEGTVPSSYFVPLEVQAFNEQVSQHEPQRQSSTRAPSAAASTSRNTGRAGSKGRFNKYRYSKGSRRSSSGVYSKGRSNAGVSKRGTAKKPASGRSTNGFGASRRGSGGGGSSRGGGIGMMPV